ncbi:MAG: hypothetical protein KF784_09485 [Fimbriimonadaceae bacterium]|nr:hypothetical protein [Fimbriimonadaceae bacterium]
MSSLARFLARWVWYGMLKFLRWSPIRKRRVGWANRLRNRGDAKAIEAYKRQERFARRHGLKLVTFLMNLLIYSLLITAAYWMTLNIYVRGGFQVPEPSGSGVNALQSPR